MPSSPSVNEARRVRRIMLSHAMAIAAVCASVVLSGESPRIAVYGFYCHCVYVLLSVGGLVRLHASGRPAWRELAQRLSRPPHPKHKSQPLKNEVNGKRVRLYGYVGLMLVLLGFTFLMVNVKDQELATPAPVIFTELRWGLLVALIWWLQDLFDKRIVLRTGAPLTDNLGYNAEGAPIGAFTLLTGGIASAVSASPWPCFVALLLWKHLFELVADVQRPDAAVVEALAIAEG